MKFPPFFLVFRTYTGNKKTFGFWFPVFIIWLILFLIALALSPLILLAALLSWRDGWGKRLLLFGPMFFIILANLHGLAIHIGEERKSFFLTFV
ncbi:MAG: hypothetical protein JXB26_06345 [Candidatus Aminicenantes bacterium]|nr:hypothetical protein [Candidatus Aminicenantes bacterium]